MPQFKNNNYPSSNFWNSNFWNVVRTVLSGVTTALVLACLNYLWRINNFMVETTGKLNAHDATISRFELDIGQTREGQQKDRNDIIQLQAILPFVKKERKHGN